MEPRYDNFRLPPRPHSPQPRPAHRPVAQHPHVTTHHTDHSPAAPKPAPAHQPHPTESPRHMPAAAPAPATHQPAHDPSPVVAAPPKAKKKRGRAKKFFKTTGVVILIAVLAGGVYAAYAYGYKPYLDKKDNAAAAPMTESVSSDPAIQLADTIGKTIDLPSETPVLVTVQDASKVSSNPFFAKTQSGDQVLYYQDAKIAVLYRPSTKKVINYSPNAVISNLQDASQESQ